MPRQQSGEPYYRMTIDEAAAKFGDEDVVFVDVRRPDEYVAGHIKVSDEMNDTADFLIKADRDWCETIVVDSNHDDFFTRWLNYVGDFRKDPANAVYFLKASLALWTAIDEGRSLNMTEWGLVVLFASTAFIAPSLTKLFQWPFKKFKKA